MMATKRTSALLIALCLFWIVPLVGGCSTLPDGLWVGPATASKLPAATRRPVSPTIEDPKRVEDLERLHERSPSFWRQKLRAKYA